MVGRQGRAQLVGDRDVGVGQRVGAAVDVDHRAAEEAGVGTEEEGDQGGDLLGGARAPDRDGEGVTKGPMVGSSRLCWSNGVSTAPGATTLRVIPAPAHPGVGAWRRTHQVTAALEAG